MAIKKLAGKVGSMTKASTLKNMISQRTGGKRVTRTPKDDDRTGSMTGAPSYLQMQNKGYMSKMAAKAKK